LKFEIKHIPREENSSANLLSKLESTKKSSNYHSMVEEVVPAPSLTLQVESTNWRAPLIDYISKGVVLENEKETRQ
jgi:hypothetical protein